MFVKLHSNLKLENLLLRSIRLAYYRWSIPERIERLPDILSVRLGTIAMPEPLESEPAGVTLESDALPRRTSLPAM
jgi:hypothetical protein